MITEWGKRMKRTIAHILVVTMMINAMSLPVYAEADHDVEKQVVTDSEKSEEIDGNIKPEEVTNEIQEDEALNNNNEIKEAESEEVNQKILVETLLKIRRYKNRRMTN